ncbi:uncharacterized protein LOC114306175 [Camellia sinensis]|uniref:uncharacterized protein LOC114306175 n=1 Tax=Camellia sinensis TaxID=4442 RepID=UPI00103626BE|nr:uncharacterized protein LOC114306175 [Camellia sinensis]
MVDTDYEKARKFEGGLRDSILEKINVLKVHKYVDVLDRAIMVEGNQANRSWYLDWKGKRQCSNVHKGSVSSQNKKQNLGASNTAGSNCDSPITCPECGKKPQGVCHRASRACFKCGKIRLIMRDCPMFGQQKGNRPTASSAGSTSATKTPTRPTTSRDNVRQWRVFALVLGYVQNLDVVVLDIPLCANLIPLDMVHFDIILGMDWSAKYHSTIDCMSKQVAFRPPDQDEFTFVGHGVLPPPYLILAMKARKLLQKGCKGYLCSILHPVTTEVGVENIQIVSEFPDVFLKEFPGDLIDHEIEFVIDIVSGTQPISKAPYRMSLAKMKELKIQLQELIDKGFIQLSTSPWSAPFCL